MVDTDGGLWMSGSHLDGAARLPLPMASVAAMYTASAVFVGSPACPFFTLFPRKFQNNVLAQCRARPIVTLLS